MDILQKINYKKYSVYVLSIILESLSYNNIWIYKLLSITTLLGGFIIFGTKKSNVRSAVLAALGYYKISAFIYLITHGFSFIANFSTLIFGLVLIIGAMISKNINPNMKLNHSSGLGSILIAASFFSWLIGYFPLNIPIQHVTIAYFIILIFIEDDTIGQKSKQFSPSTVPKKNNNTAREEFGQLGEQRVRFALDALKKLENYSVFHDFHLQSDSGFYQQIDHLAIGKNGIFHFETKTYKGEITIQEDGSWYRTHNGITERLDNPASQIDMHELVIKDVLGTKYPITNIIALGNEDIKEINVIGEKNCPYPVVYNKDIVSFIKRHQHVTIPDSEIVAMGQAILTHIKKN